MATTKDVKRLPSGRLQYRGETFSGYNKPKRTPGKNKKRAVLAKKGSEIKLVRFGDPNMTIKKAQPGRRKNFRARHNCDTAKDKFTARYWSCKAWQMKTEELLQRLIQHEKECELRYERIEERLDDQKDHLKSLDAKIWGLTVLIIITPFVDRFLL